jgi:hypothetical protein
MSETATIKKENILDDMDITENEIKICFGNLR